MTLSKLCSLNCQKLQHFCTFLLMLAKKYKAIIAICIYASESSRFALLENGIGYYAMF